MLDAQRLLGSTLEKFEKTAARVRDGVPYRTVNGVYNNMENEIDWWTNGFWAGMLWLAFRRTHNQAYAEYARGVEKKLDSAMSAFFGLHHDVGFMWHLSAVADFRITGNPVSARRGMEAATILASRYNPRGCFIKAWNGVERNGWAIIDCMMNLAILYWAADYMGDPHFSNLAQAHAQTTMRRFIREDGSVRHICVFDPVTGAYLNNLAGQGYGVESAWSRGAAWALYGFTLGAHYTGRADFLETAEKVADFFLHHLPEDHVPFADFKAPAAENIHRDTSAAACAASGLALLSTLTESGRAARYRTAAEEILDSLYRNYIDWEHDEALLQQGCTAYHAPAEEQNTSLIYGDYFFLEALDRLCGGEGLF